MYDRSQPASGLGNTTVVVSEFVHCGPCSEFNFIVCLALVARKISWANVCPAYIAVQLSAFLECSYDLVTSPPPPMIIDSITCPIIQSALSGCTLASLF